ncbi:MAG: mechanosensitive ion channel family protein [Candidatus Gracilibacteria bacterium]|jgi:small-conductance mechanosensitive channel
MIAYAATTGSDVAGESTSELAKLVVVIVERIPLWIAAFVVLMLSFLVAKIIRTMVENKMAEKGIEDEHKEVQLLGGRVAYVVVLTIGATVSLKIAGIDLTAVIAAVGFGIGFALKDLIMNFIAGIMIILGRHFTIGDFIKVNGILGRVVEIQSRVTILRAIDGTKVVVPNADLFSNTVTSYTSNPFRRLEVVTSVDYRGNLENAVRVCMSAVKNTKGVLAEPKPAILISEFGDSNIDIKVRAWVESRSAWLKTKSNLIMNIKKAYEKYNIPLAWNMTQLIYDKDCPIEEKILKVEKKAKTEAVAAAVAASNVPAPQVQVTGVAQMTPVAVPQVVEVEEQPLKPLGEIR